MPSEMKVNKISPASGTAITLGDSGDTFTIPSGVTLSGAGTSLTALNATQLTSGTIPIARIADDAVTNAKMANDAIDSAQIADNAVTLAKMAGGTDGQIITYDASGNPVAVGPGTDGQVLTSTGAGSPPAFEAATGGDKRNFIIDGDMTQWPEATAATTMAHGEYETVALWKNNKSNDGSVTVERSTDVPTIAESNHQSKYSMLIKCTGTDTSITGGQYLQKYYNMTGSDFAPLHQQQVTISFWAKTAAANSGDTYACVLRGSNGRDRSYLFEYTPTSSWTRFTHTLTMDTVGSDWEFTEDVIGVQLLFTLAAGPSLHTTANQWGGANFAGTSSTSNFMDSTSNEFYVTQVGLYLGSSAPTFTSPSISTVKDQVDWYVQRYDYNTVSYETIADGGTTNGATAVQGAMDYRRGLRVLPTITTSAGSTFRGGDGAAGVQASAIDTVRMGRNQLRLNVTVGSGLTVHRPGEILRQATSTTWIMADARH